MGSEGCRRGLSADSLVGSRLRSAPFPEEFEAMNEATSWLTAANQRGGPKPLRMNESVLSRG